MSEITDLIIGVRDYAACTIFMYIVNWYMIHIKKDIVIIICNNVSPSKGLVEGTHHSSSHSLIPFKIYFYFSQHHSLLTQPIARLQPIFQPSQLAWPIIFLYCCNFKYSVFGLSLQFFFLFLRPRFLDVETNPGLWRHVSAVCRICALQ